MYPLLLDTSAKYALWGGKRINKLLGFDNSVPAAMVGIFSGNCGFKNGDLKEETLLNFAQNDKTDFFGKNFVREEKFPVNVSIVDAYDRTPIGVSNKDRIIYVADADENSEIILGFNRNVYSETLIKEYENSALAEKCNFVKVKKGDVLTVPAGIIHAIGRGILCYIISSGNEKFYTISDYGRTDTFGRKEKIDINGALSVLDLSRFNSFYDDNSDLSLYPFGTVNDKQIENIGVSFVKLNGTVGINNRNSFTCVIPTCGEAKLSYPSGSMELVNGNAVLFPKSTTLKINGYSDFFVITLKD